VALRPNAGHGLLIPEVSRSHTTTHHSRYKSSGRVISSLRRPLPDNTQHSQQTNIHAPGGIRNYDLSRRAAVDPRLRPRGHWDMYICIYSGVYACVCVCVCIYIYIYIWPLACWCVTDINQDRQRKSLWICFLVLRGMSLSVLIFHKCPTLKWYLLYTWCCMIYVFYVLHN
jgi:hypothetical protein